MARNATLTPSAPLMIQGVQSPNVDVAPDLFFAATRRLRFPMRSAVSIAGFGSTDSVQLRQTGIIQGLEIRVFGSLTFGGTIAGTSMSYLWPFGLAKAIRLSANGQSNLINCRGLTVRGLEFITNAKLDDTGLGATFGSTAVSSGSLKLPSDDWGTSSGNALNPGAAVAAAGVYTVDLTYFVPVAADPVTLIGAVYAQTAATNLTLDIDWEVQNNLLTLGGSATVAQAIQWQVTGRAFSIPNVNGQYVVPDLSRFHQIAETRVQVTQGLNEPLLPGTGVGRQLMRLLWNCYSSGQPIPMNAANYSTLSWAYGGSDVPESYPNGTQLRAENIRVAGADIGGQWGFGLWDFASQFAARDLVDEAATSDLRLQVNLVNAPTNGAIQIAQETLFAAPVGA